MLDHFGLSSVLKPEIHLNNKWVCEMYGPKGKGRNSGPIKNQRISVNICVEQSTRNKWWMNILKTVQYTDQIKHSEQISLGWKPAKIC